MAGWEKAMKGFWAVANLSKRFWLNQMNPIVARDLNMTGMGVGKCVERAKKTLLCREMQSLFNWYDRQQLIRGYIP